MNAKSKDQDKDQDRWEKVVSKLVVDTRKGEIAWGEGTSSGFKRDDLLGLIYRAELYGKIIAVYQYNFKHFENEEEWHWLDEVAIEITSPGGALLWRFPQTKDRYRLLEVVRRQVSGADDFAETFLTDDDIPF